MLQKTVPLVLLGALAAVASAQSVSSASANLMATYEASGGIALDGIVFDEYNGTVYSDGSEEEYNYAETDGGRAMAEHSGATTHTHASGSNLFTLTSTTGASLHSADYGAIENFVESSAWKGAAYYLTFTNTGATGGSVSFSLNSQRAIQGAAASPFGVNYSPDGESDTPGAFTEASAAAGVTDVTVNPDGTGGLGSSAAAGNFRRTFDATSFYDEPNVFQPAFSQAEAGVFSPTSFNLAAGETRTYRLYTATYAYSTFYPAPVPEPASMVALGVGAFALLRRRARRA